MTHQHRANFKNLSQPNFRQRQRGMGMMGMMLVGIVCVFFGMVAFKVGPSYAEYWTISRVADDIASQPELLRGPKSKVYQRVQQAFSHNNLWDAKAEEHIRLEKDGNKGTAVHVDYESRTNLFANIYVVTKFQKEAGNGQP